MDAAAEPAAASAGALSVPTVAKAVAVAIVGVLLCAGVVVLWWRSRRRAAAAAGDNNAGGDAARCSLRPLAPLEPLPVAPNATAASRGRATTAPPPLAMLRPYDAENPGDYFGTVTLTSADAAEVRVSSCDGETGSYFEVVVYEYPSWNVAYAETCTPVVPLDFLAHGTYAVVVFAPRTAGAALLSGSVAIRPRRGGGGGPSAAPPPPPPPPQ
jgi:hypothetical protein